MAYRKTDVELHDVRPGDRAAHKDGLDSREVARVEGESVWLYLSFGNARGPFPLTNYTYTRLVDLPDPPVTPECDKMAKVREVSQGIGEFVDWLRAEKRMDLGVWTEVEGVRKDRFYAWPGNIVDLLAEHFEIDLNKVEEEKRAVLEYHRETSS